MNDQERYREYIGDLGQAAESAHKALNALYAPHAPKRSVWHRMALGRAQSILISLYVKEKKEEERTSR
jgi:hypothetical protein